MSRVTVNTDTAPKQRTVDGKPIYSHAVVAGGLVFCSGQLPKGLDGKIVTGSIQDRTHRCISNLRAVLEAAGTSLDKVVEVNVFLSDMKDFQVMNEVYLKYWGESRPARTCVAVKQLPEDTDVEIKCVAIV